MKKSTTIIIIATFLFVAGCIANFHYQTTKADAYNKVMKDAEDTYESYTNDAADLLNGKAVDFETFNNAYFYMQNGLSKWGHKSLESLETDFDRLCEISRLD